MIIIICHAEDLPPSFRSPRITLLFVVVGTGHLIFILTTPSLLESNSMGCPVSRRLKLKGWHWCLEPRVVTIVPVVALHCGKEFTMRYLRVASKVLEEL